MQKDRCNTILRKAEFAKFGPEGLERSTWESVAGLFMPALGRAPSPYGDLVELTPSGPVVQWDGVNIALRADIALVARPLYSRPMCSIAANSHAEWRIGMLAGQSQNIFSARVFS